MKNPRRKSTTKTQVILRSLAFGCRQKKHQNDGKIWSKLHLVNLTCICFQKSSLSIHKLFYYMLTKWIHLALQNVAKIGKNSFGQSTFFFWSTHNLGNRDATIRSKKYYFKILKLQNND